MTETRHRLPDNPWPALWALVLGFFMILVDSTIVSIATPALLNAFDATITEVMWVTSAFLLAYAVPLLITGRLGDRVGPKRVYLIGLVVFTLASLWCGLAGSIDSLILARVVQGLGAAMMTPQTMTVITRTFPPERRGSAMALWGATAGVATLVGPLLGGVLIDGPGWEWIFFINVPVGVIAFILALRLVPHLETHAHTFDWIGVALSAIGLLAATFAIQEGETYDWGTITGFISVPLLLGFGVLMLVVFVWWQSRVTTEPLVPLGLFRDRNFSASNAAITTVGFAITAMMFPLFVWAQLVRGLTPTQAALLIAPQAVMSILLARPVGKLVDSVHPRILACSGLLGFAVTVALMSWRMTPTAPLWQMSVLAVFMGAASSFIWGPLATSANRNLPQHLAGAGSGVYNTTRQMGAVIGSAAITALMQARITANLPAGASGAAPSGSGEGMLATAGGHALPPVVRDAISSALSESMLLPAAVVLLGFLAALALEQAQHLREPAPAAAGPGDGAAETA